MKTLLLLATQAITCLCAAQAVHTSNNLNLGVEEKFSGRELPDRWFQWGTGYKVSLDSIIKKSGKFSALIEPVGERLPNTFGCIATSIPSNYDAKEIELRAYMKFSNVKDGPIGLMIRIDTESGTEGFENMQGRNIQGSSDWSVFSVKIPYPEKPGTIFIGAILSGTGQLWVDDFQILLDGKDISEVKIRKAPEYKADRDNEFAAGSKTLSINLTAQMTTDLHVLGQIWGFLKYYHPDVAAGEYNWDYELFRILPKVIHATSLKERNSILNEWVKSIGKTPGDGAPLRFDSAKLTPDLSWIESSILGDELTASLELIKSSHRENLHYYIGLATGVGNPQFKNERPYVTMDYTDAGLRVLSLYRYWNMINYYFPYKYLIDEDWNDILTEFIPKFVNADNELQYKLTVLELIGKVDDTHANIWGSDQTLQNFKGIRYAPLEISFIEGKAVVTDYFEKALGEKSGIKIGDEVESVDGMPVQKIVKERLNLTPASNYPTKLRDIAKDLLRTNKASLDMGISSGKNRKIIPVETYGTNDISPFYKFLRRDTCFKVLNDDIGYIYPATLRNEFLSSIMTEVEKRKGLIIDFRCYPSDFIVFTLGAHLLPSPKDFVKFSTGSITTPGLFRFGKPLEVGTQNPGYYKGKVVIIVNEQTQSSAEYQTMGLRTAPNATVIGSTTAAADGNISKIVLPGGIQTAISGIGVYYPDGRETQRIGIVPDVEVKPTIKGIREGRDELLERAIAIIAAQ